MLHFASSRLPLLLNHVHLHTHSDTFCSITSRLRDVPLVPAGLSARTRLQTGAAKPENVQEVSATYSSVVSHE